MKAPQNWRTLNLTKAPYGCLFYTRTQFPVCLFHMLRSTCVRSMEKLNLRVAFVFHCRSFLRFFASKQNIVERATAAAVIETSKMEN